MPMQLRITVLPLSQPRLTQKRSRSSEAPPTVKFILPVDPNETFESVWSRIDTQYKRNYLSPADADRFIIKKLQDPYHYDIDVSFRVCQIFDLNAEKCAVTVVQGQIERESSILPTSALRPKEVHKRHREEVDRVEREGGSGPRKRRRLLGERSGLRKALPSIEEDEGGLLDDPIQDDLEPIVPQFTAPRRRSPVVAVPAVRPRGAQSSELGDDVAQVLDSQRIPATSQLKAPQSQQIVTDSQNVTDFEGLSDRDGPAKRTADVDDDFRLSEDEQDEYGEDIITPSVDQIISSTPILNGTHHSKPTSASPSRTTSRTTKSQSVSISQPTSRRRSGGTARRTGPSVGPGPRVFARPKSHWTEEEDDTVHYIVENRIPRKHWGKFLPGRSIDAVKGRAKRLNEGQGLARSSPILGLQPKSSVVRPRSERKRRSSVTVANGKTRRGSSFAELQTMLSSELNVEAEPAARESSPPPNTDKNDLAPDDGSGKEEDNDDGEESPSAPNSVENSLRTILLQSPANLQRRSATKPKPDPPASSPPDSEQLEGDQSDVESLARQPSSPPDQPIQSSKSASPDKSASPTRLVSASLDEGSAEAVASGPAVADPPMIEIESDHSEEEGDDETDSDDGEEVEKEAKDNRLENAKASVDRSVDSVIGADVDVDMDMADSESENEKEAQVETMKEPMTQEDEEETDDDEDPPTVQTAARVDGVEKDTGEDDNEDEDLPAIEIAGEVNRDDDSSAPTSSEDEVEDLEIENNTKPIAKTDRQQVQINLEEQNEAEAETEDKSDSEAEAEADTSGLSVDSVEARNLEASQRQLQSEATHARSSSVPQIEVGAEVEKEKQEETEVETGNEEDSDDETESEDEAETALAKEKSSSVSSSAASSPEPVPEPELPSSPLRAPTGFATATAKRTQPASSSASSASSSSEDPESESESETEPNLKPQPEKAPSSTSGSPSASASASPSPQPQIQLPPKRTAIPLPPLPVSVSFSSQVTDPEDPPSKFNGSSRPSSTAPTRPMLIPKTPSTNRPQKQLRGKPFLPQQTSPSTEPITLNRFPGRISSTQLPQTTRKPSFQSPQTRLSASQPQPPPISSAPAPVSTIRELRAQLQAQREDEERERRKQQELQRAKDATALFSKPRSGVGIGGASQASQGRRVPEGLSLFDDLVNGDGSGDDEDGSETDSDED